jgi:hypothetical protein
MTKDDKAKKVTQSADPQLSRTCKALLSDDTWCALSPEFYTTFWSYSMYDLNVPSEQLFKARKDHWLDDVSDRNLTVTKFLQNCIIPRCFSSGIDALYCAKFVMVLHEINTLVFYHPLL